MPESIEPTRISDDEWDRLKASSTTAPQTESEQLFSNYLSQRDCDWCFEPAFSGKSKRPDFAVRIAGVVYLFEVKERSPHPIPKAGECCVPWKGIRDEINEARRKLGRFKEYCCGIVIRNVGDWRTDLDAESLFAAMVGDLGCVVRVPKHSSAGPVVIHNGFLPQGGKMVRHKTGGWQNTTISVLIGLQQGRIDNPEFQRLVDGEVAKRQASTEHAPDANDRAAVVWDVGCEGQVPAYTHILRAVVCENPGARIPFPRDMFKGPFDETWALVDGRTQQVYAGARVSELACLDGEIQRC